MSKTINCDFEYDSSPESWKLFKILYKDHILDKFKDYNFDNLNCYNYISPRKYSIEPSKDKVNRLFCFKNDAIITEDTVSPTARLSGETDFNFNDSKIAYFNSIAAGDIELLNLLQECSTYHKSEYNISLMQSMGNMQGIKGKNRYDRIDVFVSNLNTHFKKELESDFFKDQKISSNNIKACNDYLSLFVNFSDYDNAIYNYCKVIYLMDREYVDKLLESSKYDISNPEHLKIYISLAFEYWKNKKIIIEMLKNN